MKNIKPLYLPALYQDSAAEGRVILRDGTTAHLRLSTPADREAMADFYRRLSPDSRRSRFFTERKPGPELIGTLCDSSEPAKQQTLIVTRLADGQPRIIASASYMAHDTRRAEFAVAVEDAFQGKGLGGILLERLSVLAARQGFVHFMALTDGRNRAMLETFRSSGFERGEAPSEGLVEVDLSVRPGPQSVAHSEARDRLFTTASIRPFFRPSSIAVIGSLREDDGLGRRMLEALSSQPFDGAIYAVDPRPLTVTRQDMVTTARTVPAAVDLAIIASPAEQVMDVVSECAAQGVRAVLVISPGFAESGEEGARLQQMLAEKIRGYGMRLVGPNSLGLLNTDPDVCLHAVLTHALPRPGRVAVSSQSGALGLAVLELADRLNLGLSSFISMGNKADVTGNDLLQYWEEDPHTGVILLYLESFGNPRRFARIARRVSRSKPIVCVKSGRSTAGAAVTTSPTSLLSVADAAVEALFHQTGVLRADTLEEMFDLAVLLAHQPPARGNRVAIVTNARGPGVLCADACLAGRLAVPTLSESTQRRLRGHHAGSASVLNPIDLGGAASLTTYGHAVETALCDKDIDAVIALHTPVGRIDQASFARALTDGVNVARQAGVKDKPIVAVTLADGGESATLRAGGELIPRFLFPESAARALAQASRYAAWRRDTEDLFPEFTSTDPEAVRALCRAALAQRGPGWLSDEDTRQVAAHFQLALSADAAPADGVDVILAVKEDPLFGPLIAFGLAGVYVDLLKDVAFRITPLTEADARAMVREIKGFPLLQGYAGHPPVDIEALEELLLRISFLVEEVPEIREIELNPVRALGPGLGTRIRSCRIRVEQPGPTQPVRYTLPTES